MSLLLKEIIETVLLQKLPLILEGKTEGTKTYPIETKERFIQVARGTRWSTDMIDQYFATGHKFELIVKRGPDGKAQRFMKDTNSDGDWQIFDENDRLVKSSLG